MSLFTAIEGIADLVEEVRPTVGQDCELRYRVRTDKTLVADETITGWTLYWVLATSKTATAATFVKTTAAATIAIATPYATVTLTAANMATLTAEATYFMQLWRNESGNKYPLSGIGTFTPQYGLPLA